MLNKLDFIIVITCYSSCNIEMMFLSFSGYEVKDVLNELAVFFPCQNIMVVLEHGGTLYCSFNPAGSVGRE